MARTVEVSVGTIVLVAVTPSTTSCDYSSSSASAHEEQDNRSPPPHRPFFPAHHYSTAQINIDAQTAE